ncbi:hypothetical protein ACFVWT_19415 [Arthrobacter sp. NPDC058288]|uniref:hypothetical protein n=1 Tax=Arthrobacter sp. NPDC058288 TaxID=3346424 RepID=UPI0036E94E97
MAIYLGDLKRAHSRCRRATESGFELFLAEPLISDLGWPENVIEQMLWDHGETEHFVPDYGAIDLTQVAWMREAMPTELIQNVPTGASDHGAIEDYAKNPVYWAEKRGAAVVDSWDQNGTWLVPPLLISRDLLKSGAKGWQLIEGRTRVGVLRGRVARQLHVATHHDTWVGRGRPAG